MRILYFTDTRVVGGAERNLADVAGGSAAAGHAVLIAAPQRALVEWLTREAPAARVLQALKDTYHDAPTPPRRAGSLLVALAQLVHLLRRIRPDLVHVNNGGFPGSDLCRIAPLAARIAGVGARVMTVHSNPWPRERVADPRVQTLADRLVWSSVNAVVSPSEAVADGLAARRGMPGLLGHTIHYGCRAAVCDPEAVARLRARLAPGGELIVGMVSARPVPEKGYEVFLQALAGTGERVRGVLVGHPPEGLQASARAAGVGNRLAIEGPRRQLGDYYGAFDVLVVPSIAEECMPLVILEAASAGTPTFGSRLAGIPEAIADGVSGRLFEPGAGGELAGLIVGAAGEREAIAAMGAAARRRWEERFEIGSMVRATLELYARLAANPRPARLIGDPPSEDPRPARPTGDPPPDDPRAARPTDDPLPSFSRDWRTPLAIERSADVHGR
jgi:glycosyltransferase involved in cell wall biosynthesis